MENRSIEQTHNNLKKIHKNMNAADLRGANFSYTEIHGFMDRADCSGANISNSEIICSVLMNANFKDTDLSNTTIYNCLLDKAIFTNANLMNSIFINTDITFDQLNSACSIFNCQISVFDLDKFDTSDVLKLKQKMKNEFMQLIKYSSLSEIINIINKSINDRGCFLKYNTTSKKFDERDDYYKSIISIGRKKIIEIIQKLSSCSEETVKSLRQLNSKFNTILSYYSLRPTLLEVELENLLKRQANYIPPALGPRPLGPREDNDFYFIY